MNYDNLCVTTLRCLSMDVIDKANSGHPGMALGSAPIMHTLFSRHINATSIESKWIKRDRFILSSGHVSSLLYCMLHLCGYEITLDDLKQFRQLNSKTPGHPEAHLTDGVDFSTGPLGQGLASSVGIAMAERHLVATYPQLSKVLEHYTYVLCGDGDLEEGVAIEAMSLAGLYKLNKLIVCYDNNDVTLDGPLAQSNVENIKMKAEAMNWNVLEVLDGNDIESIDKAIEEAKLQQEKPTLIICKTVIGYGSKLAGTCAVHGAPLKKEGSTYLKEKLNWNYPDFYIPEETKNYYRDSFISRGVASYMEYKKNVQQLTKENQELLQSIIENKIETNLLDLLPTYEKGYKNSTRNVSGLLLNILSDNTNKLFGGSADVAKSVMTGLKNQQNFTADNYSGKNINFGIREFAMAAICNGIASHGGLHPYCGSFLVFVDYFKAAMRMAALMQLPTIYLLSHDSIAVGEDGPTHEPIEQFAMLRSIPNFNLIRPCDANETVGAYKIALTSTKTPTAIILSRQNLTQMVDSNADMVKYGAYVISKEKERIDAIIIATGSEVELAINAQQRLLEEGIDVRVVSMPSMYLFENQSEEYKDKILPKNVNKRLAIEMASEFGWHKYANNVMSINEFGRSGKAEDVINFFGFTIENVVNKIKNIIK